MLAVVWLVFYGDLVLVSLLSPNAMYVNLHLCQVCAWLLVSSENEALEEVMASKCRLRKRRFF